MMSARETAVTITSFAIIIDHRSIIRSLFLGLFLEDVLFYSDK
jgi:hypothetical protein